MDPASWVMLGIILLLLLVSALFSAIETAFTAASRAFVLRRAREGDARAARLSVLSERKEHVVAAILLGNNMVNITATALASAMLIAWFGEGGVIYASLIMTALLVVFSEVLPKTVSLRGPDNAALRLTPLLSVIMTLLGPVATGVNAIVRRTLGLFGMRTPAGESPGITEDELLGAIEMHGLGQKGAADLAAAEERRMLRGVLALDDLTVREVMTHRSRVVALDADQPPRALLARLLEQPHARLPLWRRDGEEILGIITAREVLRALQHMEGDAGRLDFAALATAPLVVSEGRPIRSQLQDFRKTPHRLAIVVDEYGTVKGIITLEDILEVVVGPIAERGEAILSDLAASGALEIRGDVRVRDLNRELGWHLPENEAATLGGLVVARHRTVPPVGQELALNGFQIRVLERRGQRIDRLSVRPPEDAPP